MGAASSAMSSAVCCAAALRGSPLLPTIHRNSPRRLPEYACAVNTGTQDVVAGWASCPATNTTCRVCGVQISTMWCPEPEWDKSELLVGLGGEPGGPGGDGRAGLGDCADALCGKSSRPPLGWPAYGPVQSSVNGTPLPFRGPGRGGPPLSVGQIRMKKMSPVHVRAAGRPRGRPAGSVRSGRRCCPFGQDVSPHLDGAGRGPTIQPWRSGPERSWAPAGWPA